MKGRGHTRITHSFTNDLVHSLGPGHSAPPRPSASAHTFITHRKTNDKILPFFSSDISTKSVGKIGELSPKEENVCNLFINNRLLSLSKNYPPSRDWFPPYSVDGFKAHLKLKNNKLEILKHISKDGGEIETAFVERISQLLKPQGVAAVILPTSILDKTDDSYVAARELIFKNFNIRAIVLLKGSTFSETATKTSILFLQKYPEPPRRDRMVYDSVNYILNAKDIRTWEDCEILKSYLEEIQVDDCDYFAFCNQSKDIAFFSTVDYFSQYVEWFNGLPEIISLPTEKKFALLTPEEKDKEINYRFFKKVKEIEASKLYYFSLIYKQRTLIITAPNDKGEEKRFLGYKWSKRKGLEGIQIITPGGKLYNASNRYDDDSLSGLVRLSFIEKENDELPLSKYYSYCSLKKLIDFQHVDFKKQIRASKDKVIEIVSSYPLRDISTMILPLESGARPSGGVDQYSSGALSLGGEHIDNKSGHINLSKPKFVPVDFYNSSSKGKVKDGDILLCKDGALTGKVALVRNELSGRDAMINEHVFIIRCSDADLQKFVFIVLYSEIGQALLKSNITGSSQGGLNSSSLNKMKIPAPPVNIMKKVISSFEDIENEYSTTRMSDETHQKKITDMLANLKVAAIKEPSDETE